MLGKLSYFTNLNLKAIWGWFPLLTIISRVGLQWGRDEIYPNNMYAGEWRWWTCNFIHNTCQSKICLVWWNTCGSLTSCVKQTYFHTSQFLCEMMVILCCFVEASPRSPRSKSSQEISRTMLTRDSVASISSIISHTHRIHVCYGNIYHLYTPNVSIYKSYIPYMDPMG